ncbi:MAG: DotH/IcmK family type IV secretion protein [Deltaproteobacteria bacterium]|nr:DotH/IcmK family type IV secretion protein [Deltaproteobacteria bacterium]
MTRHAWTKPINRQRAKQASRLLLVALLLALPLSAFAAESVPQRGAAPGEDRKRRLEETIEDILPLDEGEIRRYKRERDSRDSAIEPVPARMFTQTRQIHATPDAISQVVRLTAGYSSTIVFQDATGAPWPVLSIILGSAAAFEASQPKVELESLPEGQAPGTEGTAKAQAGGQAKNVNSNMINIIPLTNHASSNLVVTLEGLPYPLIVHLLTDSAAKDDRMADALVVFRLDKHGPQAAVSHLLPSMPTTVTPEMLLFIHGIAPPGAVQVSVEPKFPGLSLWAYKNRLFLRTSYAVVWPAWSSVANGEDMRVYVLPKTPSIVVAVSGSHHKLIVGAQQ